MIDPCYYCLCKSYINNLEDTRVKLEEIRKDCTPCFICDNCCVYDGDVKKKNMEIESCEKYLIDNYNAKKNRGKIKIIYKGNNNES